MDEEFEELLESVKILNEYFEESIYVYPPFSVVSDGYNYTVKYLGVRIWSSVDDDRDFIEEENRYEGIEDLLKREAKKINEEITKFWKEI